MQNQYFCELKKQVQQKTDTWDYFLIFFKVEKWSLKKLKIVLLPILNSWRKNSGTIKFLIKVRV